MSVEDKHVDSGHPTAGLLLDLVLRRPSWYPWGTPRTCPTVHHVTPCRPVVGWAFGQGDLPRSSVLHACSSLLSVDPSTPSLSPRSLLSFWNGSFPFQGSSLPVFSVVLCHRVEECEFLPHLILCLLSYDTYDTSSAERPSAVCCQVFTTVHELEHLHAKLCAWI